MPPIAMDKEELENFVVNLNHTHNSVKLIANSTKTTVFGCQGMKDRKSAKNFNFFQL